jgi:hypothetical protein
MARRTLGFVALAIVTGVVSAGLDTSCKVSVPELFCRGETVNAKDAGARGVGRSCTECVENRCCDLVGDCQDSACAGEVASTHACVLEAGRAGAADEPRCLEGLHSPQGRDTYSCMRSECGEACGLPVCRLAPLVPRMGTVECDGCFAQACCAEMNACSENRSCLLALQCIAERCRGDFEKNLTRARHDLMLWFVASSCPGAPWPPEAYGVDPASLPDDCFMKCADELAPAGTPDGDAARCLAARVNECGADVECGERCRSPKDAAAD